MPRVPFITLLVKVLTGRRSFPTEKTKRIFLERLGDLFAESKISCWAWALIPNHFHLLLRTGNESIPNSMQLIAGRRGQDYNQRKDRKGAFWRDRYHATAVSFDDHLFECMIYVDMNMVRRAGVVDHPREWPFCGYNEIQNPRQRYAIIDYRRLISLLQMKDLEELQKSCRNRIEQALGSREQPRDGKWSESTADVKNS